MSTDPREFEHPIDGTTPNELPTVLGVGSLPTGHPDSDPILRAACWAVMREYGYPDAEIQAAENMTHKAAGCEWEGNTFSWLCEDENDNSLHPEMDELDTVEFIIRTGLEAAQLFIAAQAKAEALREARDITPDSNTRGRLVDMLLTYKGTPMHRLFEYPHRDDDSRRMVREAETSVSAILAVLQESTT